MILPTKHIGERHTLLALGALLLSNLKRPQTVSSLWEQVRQMPSVGTFDRFVLALDMLFIFGLVNVDGALLAKVRL